MSKNNKQGAVDLLNNNNEGGVVLVVPIQYNSCCCMICDIFIMKRLGSIATRLRGREDILNIIDTTYMK